MISRPEVTKKLKKRQAPVDTSVEQKSRLAKRRHSQDIQGSEKRRGSSPAEELKLVVSKTFCLSIYTLPHFDCFYFYFIS